MWNVGRNIHVAERTRTILHPVEDGIILKVEGAVPFRSITDSDCFANRPDMGILWRIPENLGPDA